MQMYLFGTTRTRTRSSTSATSTAATTRRSSGTSTRTACRTAWSRNDDGSGALSQPARRRDGRGLERLVRARPAAPRGPRDRRCRRRARSTSASTPTPCSRRRGSSRPTAVAEDDDDARCPAACHRPAAATRSATSASVLRLGPEVHADGEIWTQTLWDLRSELVADARHEEDGSDAAEAADHRRAMRLSPPEPSFLDVRNAILAADGRAGEHAPRPRSGRCSRDRGMGFFAGVARLQRHAPRRGLQPAAGAERAEGPDRRHGHRRPTPGCRWRASTVGFGGPHDRPDVPGLRSRRRRRASNGALHAAPRRPAATAACVFDGPAAASTA